MTTKKESATYTNKRAIHIASYSVHLGIWIKARLWCIQMCIEWHWTSINILKPFGASLFNSALQNDKFQVHWDLVTSQAAFMEIKEEKRHTQTSNHSDAETAWHPELSL